MRLLVSSSLIAIGVVFAAADLQAGGIKKIFNCENCSTVSPQETASEVDGNKNDKQADAKVEPVANNQDSTETVKKPESDHPVVAPSNVEKGLVALVDSNIKIFESDINKDIEFLKSSNPQVAASIPEDKLFGVMLEQKIRMILAKEAAKRIGLDQSDDMKLKIEKAKEELISREYVLKEIKNMVESKGAIEARYEKYKKEFPDEQKYKLLHIMCEKEQEAKDIINSINSGKNFGDLAKDKSIAHSRENGGDEGFIFESSLPQSIKSEIVGMKVGNHSKAPLKTEAGWHVFKLVSIEKAMPLPFDEIKDRLREIMSSEAMLKVVDTLEKLHTVARYKSDGTAFTQADLDNLRDEKDKAVKMLKEILYKMQ